jgi:hypothetical protein
MNKLLAALLSLSMTAMAHDNDNAYGHSDYYRSGDYAQKELNKKIDKALDSYQPPREQSAYDKKREEIYEDAKRELQEE